MNEGARRVTIKEIFSFFRRGANMNRIKVLIADDHRDFRRVVHNFLDRLPNVSVVGEAMNGDDAVKKVEKLFPDIVLMDISMPLMDGIEATRVIKQRWPVTKVHIVTSFDDPICRKEARDAKADGYILKESLKPSLESMFGVQK
jgi:DNA-binding NarL/FixJ family response regulator